MPGVSRSGITITAGRFAKLDRDAAARFSFLLLIPIVLGAVLYKGLKHIVLDPLPAGSAGPFIVGTIASAAVGLVAIDLLLGYVRRHSYLPFVLYRLVIAALIVIVIRAAGAAARSERRLRAVTERFRGGHGHGQTPSGTGWRPEHSCSWAPSQPRRIARADEQSPRPHALPRLIVARGCVSVPSRTTRRPAEWRRTSRSARDAPSRRRRRGRSCSRSRPPGRSAAISSASTCCPRGRRRVCST